MEEQLITFKTAKLANKKVCDIKGSILQEALKKLPSQRKLKYTDVDEARMDIIGQNGNDGLHYGREEDDW